MHRIDIVPVFGQSGYRYDVYHEGALICERSRMPLADACRALAGVAKFGKVEMWRKGGTCPAMIAEIEHTATRTITENEKTGPKWGKWQPFKRGEA